MHRQALFRAGLKNANFRGETPKPRASGAPTVLLRALFLTKMEGQRTTFASRTSSVKFQNFSQVIHKIRFSAEVTATSSDAERALPSPNGGSRPQGGDATRRGSPAGTVFRSAFALRPMVSPAGPEGQKNTRPVRAGCNTEGARLYFCVFGGRDIDSLIFRAENKENFSTPLLCPL